MYWLQGHSRPCWGGGGFLSHVRCSVFHPQQDVNALGSQTVDLSGELLFQEQESLDFCVGTLQGVASLDQERVQILQRVAQLVLPQRHDQQLVQLILVLVCSLLFSTLLFFRCAIIRFVFPLVGTTVVSRPSVLRLHRFRFDGDWCYRGTAPTLWRWARFLGPRT